MEVCYKSCFLVLSEQNIVGLLWTLVGASPRQKPLHINHSNQLQPQYLLQPPSQLHRTRLSVQGKSRLCPGF